MSLSTDLTSRNACSTECIPPRKHAGRPGETHSKSDEETVPAKIQRTTDPQTNKAGGANEGAQEFGINMAAVIGLQGIRRIRGKENGDNFELSTKVTSCGNFDVIRYAENERQYFLLLKYADNPGTNKLLRAELKPIINACLKTYIDMADRDMCEFIIYTNQYLVSSLLEYTTEVSDADTIFKTSDKGKIFKFTTDDKKKKDVYAFLEEPMSEYKCLSNEEKEFLNNLIIFTGQQDQWELDDLIEEEIRNQDVIKVDSKKYSSILHHFKMLLGSWWRSKKRQNMTPEMLTNWLQRAKTEAWASDISGLFETCTKMFLTTGIQFSYNEVSRLHDELSDKRAVHLRSDALTLCSVLLLDCLPQYKCIYVTFELLQSNKNMLLYAWFGGYWERLIVFCDSAVRKRDISDTCHDIHEKITRANSSKSVIILTAYSVSPIKNFVPIKHKFNFEQLSEKSQETVLKKKIEFQGCEVTLRSVLQRHGNVEHVLGPELVTEGTAVIIGGTLQRNTEHYETRVLKKKIWFPLDIIRNRDTYPDVFAVSGTEENRLVDIVPSEEEVGHFHFDKDSETENLTQNNDVSEKRFIVLQGRDLKSSFSKLCDSHSGETLHWLKYEDGKLLWKKTYGDIENLLNCVDAEKEGRDKQILRECLKSRSCEVNEEDVWELGERTVLVVAEPGMGKSSTTTQMAWNTKSADPTSWVVRINWNDHARKLQAINATRFNSKSLVKFLCRAALPKSKHKDIKRKLFKQALLYSGNVTVLMDGFEEISPIYMDKVAAVLHELIKTKVERVWVTSRPVQKERLEKELSVVAWSMKKLSNESQESILQKSCMHKVILNKYKKCLPSFTDMPKLYEDKNITGTPAYIRTIATTLELIVEMQRITEGSNVTNEDGLSFLLKNIRGFYETVRRMDEEEEGRRKKEDDLSRCQLNVEESTYYRVSHIFLEKPLGEEEIQPFIKRVQAGKDKVSIVLNLVEDRSHFIHRTFAEYCTAHWFSKNFDSNRSVLQPILFDSSYGMVKDMFDRILARGCPLHCVVLNWDTDAVETLLKGGSNVLVLDSGSRTAMHLFVAQGPDNPVCVAITNSLLHRVATVNAEDMLLQRTALPYEIRTNIRLVRDRLLEKNVQGN